MNPLTPEATRAHDLANKCQVLQCQNEELLTLAYRYKSDLLHPVTDSGSLERRIQAIDAVIEIVAPI